MAGKRIYTDEERKERRRESVKRRNQTEYTKNKMKPVNKKYRQSFNGKISRMYSSMKLRTKKKGYKEIINREAFIKFASDNMQYRTLYNIWVSENYQMKYCPTIDRIDNSKGYIEGNLQFLNQRENTIKGYLETNRSMKPVRLIKDNENLIFNSAKEASTFLGKYKSYIYFLIKNNKTYNGYSAQYI